MKYIYGAGLENGKRVYAASHVKSRSDPTAFFISPVSCIFSLHFVPLAKGTEATAILRGFSRPQRGGQAVPLSPEMWKGRMFKFVCDLRFVMCTSCSKPDKHTHAHTGAGYHSDILRLAALQREGAERYG